MVHLTLLTLVLTMFSCSHLTSRETAKNAIFYIVDGMGPAQVTGARLYKGGPEARLTLETLPVTGFVRTYSSNDFVTDSASAATAYASGVRTFNRSIGMSDPDLDPTGTSRPLSNLAERAKQAGKSVGIVTTARVTHATPAAFFSQVSHRNEEEAIALQLLEAKHIDLLIGGGRGFFKPISEGGRRKDQRSLLDDFNERGMTVIQDYERLQAIPVSDSQRPIMALLEEDHLPYEDERQDHQLSLADLVEIAINHLEKNPKGYLLIVEPARVDHAAHMNWARHVFEEMLAFDLALERSLARSSAKDTLIVVTADHETGGLALNGYASYSAASGVSLLKNHTRDFARSEFNHGFISWASGPGYDSPQLVDESVRHFRHKAAYPAPRGSAYHTAVDVGVFARGPGMNLFQGFQDNTDIAHRLVQILELSPL